MATPPLPVLRQCDDDFPHGGHFNRHIVFMTAPHSPPIQFQRTIAFTQCRITAQVPLASGAEADSIQQVAITPLSSIFCTASHSACNRATSARRVAFSHPFFNCGCQSWLVSFASLGKRRPRESACTHNAPCRSSVEPCTPCCYSWSAPSAAARVAKLPNMRHHLRRLMCRPFAQPRLRIYVCFPKGKGLCCCLWQCWQHRFIAVNVPSVSSFSHTRQPVGFRRWLLKPIPILHIHPVRELNSLYRKPSPILIAFSMFEFFSVSVIPTDAKTSLPLVSLPQRRGSGLFHQSSSPPVPSTYVQSFLLKVLPWSRHFVPFPFFYSRCCASQHQLTLASVTNHSKRGLDDYRHGHRHSPARAIAARP